MRGLFLGAVLTVLVLAGAGYLFLIAGGISLATTATPLPGEEKVAKIALRASIGSAREVKNPLTVDETNLLAAAHTYNENCAICHSGPGHPKTAVAKGMFPPPPQLFDKEDMVTDDPEGVTYWKLTHGIRLSGMPGFGATLSDLERWQVTMLLNQADKLPPTVLAAMAH